MQVTRRISDLLHLDDLRVGRRFVSGTHTIDETQIKAFAREFDPQPFHLDDDAARQTLFAGLAAWMAHRGNYDAFAGGKRTASRGRDCRCRRGAELAATDAAR